MAEGHRITVRCEPDPNGWRCEVTLGTDPGATRHQVTVRADDARRLGTGATVDGLLRASFVFLLEHEPRESILHSFDLSVISRYFPDYEHEIRRRLAD
jgi:hypothetical protein